MHHYAGLICVVLVEIGFHHIGQAGRELMISGNPPASLASPSAGITGVSPIPCLSLLFNSTKAKYSRQMFLTGPFRRTCLMASMLLIVFVTRAGNLVLIFLIDANTYADVSIGLA